MKSKPKGKFYNDDPSWFESMDFRSQRFFLWMIVWLGLIAAGSVWFIVVGFGAVFSRHLSANPPFNFSLPFKYFNFPVTEEGQEAVRAGLWYVLAGMTPLSLYVVGFVWWLRKRNRDDEEYD